MLQSNTSTSAFVFGHIGMCRFDDLLRGVFKPALLVDRAGYERFQESVFRSLFASLGVNVLRTLCLRPTQLHVGCTRGCVDRSESPDLMQQEPNNQVMWEWKKTFAILRLRTLIHCVYRNTPAIADVPAIILTTHDTKASSCLLLARYALLVRIKSAGFGRILQTFNVVENRCCKLMFATTILDNIKHHTVTLPELIMRYCLIV